MQRWNFPSDVEGQKKERKKKEKQTTFLGIRVEVFCKGQKKQ